jgi:hypothetical protein
MGTTITKVQCKLVLTRKKNIEETIAFYWAHSLYLGSLSWIKQLISSVLITLLNATDAFPHDLYFSSLFLRYRRCILHRLRHLRPNQDH